MNTKNTYHKYFTLLLTSIIGICHFPVIMSQPVQELSLYGGGGLSTLKYQTTTGDRKEGFGGVFGIGYHYFFTGSIGIGTGVALSFYHSKILTDHFSDRYMHTDIEGNKFEFRTVVSNYHEKQHAILANIPLMITYRSESQLFYASAGGKIGLPVRGRYKTKGTTITNSGYYARENYEYTTQKFLGFGTFTDKNTDETIHLGITYSLAAETGIRWKINKKVFLYTGIYVDVGLNHMIKNEPVTRFVSYNAADPKDFTTHSVLTSGYIRDDASETFTGKVIPLSAGIKIGLTFGVDAPKRIKKKIRPKKTPASKGPKKTVPAKATAPAKKNAVPVAETPQDTTIVAVEATTTEKKATIIATISFLARSNTALTARQKAMLDNSIALLKKDLSLHVVCEGHTCDLGNETLNWKIGLQRATAVKTYLVESGIDAHRIAIESKGGLNPVVPNDSEENRRKNRRVEFLILE